MYPRAEYEMTTEQEKTLLDACKPTSVMLIGGYAGSTPQENANAAWRALGEQMGFDSMSVRPVPGKGQRFFSAVPSETPEQRDARMAHEAAEKRQAEIDKLTHEIAERETRLAALREREPL